MPGNGHVRFGPEVAGKGPAPSGHLAGGLPAPRTRAARYLGYEIIVQHADRKIPKRRRAPTGTTARRAPRNVTKEKRAPSRPHGNPWPRPAMQNLDDYDIIQA